MTFDWDDDGALDATELELYQQRVNSVFYDAWNAMNAAGIYIRTLMDIMDTDRSGKLSPTELLKLKDFEVQ